MQLEIHLRRNITDMSSGKCFEIIISDIASSEMNAVATDLKRIIRAHLQTTSYYIEEINSNAVKIELDSPLGFEAVESIFRNYLKGKK